MDVLLGIHLKKIKTMSYAAFLVAPKPDSWLSALGVCVFLYNALEIVVYVIEIAFLHLSYIAVIDIIRMVQSEINKS